MRSPCWSLVMVGCVASFGGAVPRYFSPVEAAHTRAVRGYDVAYFELASSAGVFGELMVWSKAEYRERDLAVLELTLALRNTGAQELTIAASDLILDALHTSEPLPGALRPAESGTFRVPPGSDRRLVVHFVLPAGLSPFDVTGFTLQWRVRSGFDAFARHTPFHKEPGRCPYRTEFHRSRCPSPVEPRNGPVRRGATSPREPWLGPLTAAESSAHRGTSFRGVR